MKVWSEGSFGQPWKEKSLHREQTISEMVEEVLANQAKSLAEQTGQAFESVLGVVASTEAGQQLRELANGEHRHEKAREWLASVQWERAEQQLNHLLGRMSAGALQVNAITRGLRGTWSGSKVRKHAHRIMRFWKRSLPACKGE